MYVETPTDPKIRRLKPAQRWLWVCVLAAARQSPVSGVLLITDHVPWTFEDLADYAAVPRKMVATTFDEFREAKMITATDAGWKVVNWSERQFEGDFSRSGISDETRAKVFTACNYQCAECGTAEGLQIDHIIPVTRGGTNDLRNLQVLCGPCNRKKGNRIRQQNHRHNVTSGNCDNHNEVTSRLCSESESESDTEVITQVSTDTHDSYPQPVDDDLLEPGIGRDACWLLAQRDLARREAAKGPTHRPDLWLKTAFASRQVRHAQQLASSTSMCKTAEELADWLDPPKPPDPQEQTGKAQAALYDRDRSCPECAGCGHVIDDNFESRPCALCQT